MNTKKRLEELESSKKELSNQVQQLRHNLNKYESSTRSNSNDNNSNQNNKQNRQQNYNENYIDNSQVNFNSKILILCL
jgi:chromosome segregation ATPase